MLLKRIFQCFISKRYLPRGSFGRKCAADEPLSKNDDFDDDIDESLFGSTFKWHSFTGPSVRASATSRLVEEAPSRGAGRRSAPSGKLEPRHRPEASFRGSLQQPDPSLDEAFLEEQPMPPPSSTFEERQLRRALERRQLLRRREVPRESESLLTWAAKDQLRQLHARDPAVWTPEQLARSFPVSVEGARRLLRSKAPANFSKSDVQKHDRAVNQRWRELTRPERVDAEKTSVSQNTRLMLETGLTKFIPLKNFGVSEERETPEPDVDDSLATCLTSYEEGPDDGPFLKLYKKHMRWKEAAKGLAAEEPGDALDKQDWLRSVVFKDYLNFDPVAGGVKVDADDHLVMQLCQFKKRMQKRLAASPNRFDQRAARHGDKTHR